MPCEARQGRWERRTGSSDKPPQQAAGRLWLSGPWSAAYDNGDSLNDNNCNLNKDGYLCRGDKSLYTLRVFVQVTPPAP